MLTRETKEWVEEYDGYHAHDIDCSFVRFGVDKIAKEYGLEITADLHRALAAMWYYGHICEEIKKETKNKKSWRL
tara:strand:+ start:253 stop:477 length:225 start_codon:yes stop_codon:yes gene_type:complete